MSEGEVRMWLWLIRLLKLELRFVVLASRLSVFIPSFGLDPGAQQYTNELL
jgi:hypothetical protein